MTTRNQVTDTQLQNISIEADRRGDDRVFALCAAAYLGDAHARQTIADAYAALKARRARTVEARRAR